MTSLGSYPAKTRELSMNRPIFLFLFLLWGKSRRHPVFLFFINSCFLAFPFSELLATQAKVCGMFPLGWERQSGCASISYACVCSKAQSQFDDLIRQSSRGMSGSNS